MSWCCAIVLCVSMIAKQKDSILQASARFVFFAHALLSARRSELIFDVYTHVAGTWKQIPV